MSDADIVKEARERFEACQEATKEQRLDMLDDLRFSNPANPEQWPEQVRKMREQAEGGPRPCLTFDQTNQYVFQVVNDARQNKPSIKVRPVDSQADIKVADALQGMIRHIEDYSRADIAYDTSVEYAARCGLGWIRVLTRVVNDGTNEQELCIQRVADPLSIMLDPDWQEPDGSDAMFGFAESWISKRAFARDYPDAEVASWDANGPASWVMKDAVRIAEYFNLIEEKTSMVTVEDPMNPGFTMDLAEDEYWQAVKETGERFPVLRQYWAKRRRCCWYKMSGSELLVPKTEFPSSYVPLVPVIGSELWVEGKRSLCGLVRPMKDPQRAYNYDRSNYIEQVSLQTKVPYLVAAESIEGHEGDWGRANRSNAAYLPFNHLDANGNPVPPPRRELPPQASQAYVEGAQQSQNDIQASIGMYRANLGAPSNETSGRAINARQKQGETANMHYTDNRNRSLAHVGRILVEAIPRVYDTKRDQRILGEDGTSSIVTLDPQQKQAAAMKGVTLASFNPAIGRYDVSVQAGPAFGTRRQEAVESLSEIINGNPQMMALLGDVYVGLMDIPEGEKVAKRLKFALPPEVQQAEAAESGEGPDPAQQLQEAQQQLDQAQQQGQQMQLALQGAQQHVSELEAQLQQVQQSAEAAERDRQAELAKAQMQADADVEQERIKAEAQVQTASINAASQQTENRTDLVQAVLDMAESLREQNGHILLAVSAIADEMVAKGEAERHPATVVEIGEHPDGLF